MARRPDNRGHIETGISGFEAEIEDLSNDLNEANQEIRRLTNELEEANKEIERVSGGPNDTQ